ncbi:Oidioi.mRNA.OKI2018_I69.XSR.g15788.t1.cds [Oikopleura dioica]|uniref:Leucine zipper transcription factor-like protein 1 n=1 Tax=Oikopleura dioica TaxID=34765 RepID=A0ABN7SHX9_OIKDI|nr:Oidioi.mRNA.OKI2018_I69.XSR.g15788.t1.cds [Oikopleura dioica]
MENSLGLTEHHKYQILELLRYSRYKRKEKVIGIELAFQDFVDTRVMEEDTFTQDEVRDLVNELQRSIVDEVESELINSCDVSALLLRQVMQQADKWKLKLSCDVKQVENLELLSLIREFEQNESGTKTSPSKMSLENQNLKEKNANLEERLSSTISEKTKAQSSLNSVKNADSGDLEKMKNELLVVKNDLLAKEKELDAKFRETSVYKNMKVLLDKKNVQIKELRAKVPDNEDDYLKE